MKSENPKLMALHFSNVDKKKFRSGFREVRLRQTTQSLLENVASDRILLFITHHLEIKVEYFK